MFLGFNKMENGVTCGFCHYGKSVEDVCEQLWCINNAKTSCAAHWKCMVMFY
jgi:hypothetical protein